MASWQALGTAGHRQAMDSKQLLVFQLKCMLLVHTAQTFAKFTMTSTSS